MLTVFIFPQTATTPWIALVACDANATDASQEIDIFTAAKDRGAVAAVRLQVLHLPSLLFSSVKSQ